MTPQIKFLEEISRSEKIPHAFLFEGPEGTGKKETALKFAKMILGSEIGNHPDFLLIEPKNETISIDQIRNELIRFLCLTPLCGNKKIAILNRAETMAKEAQNALLKTLEEPRGNAILILISSKPELLLPTIISRCQKISFSYFKKSELEKLLNEKDPKEKEEILKTAQGNLKRLENILKNGFKERKEKEKLVEKILKGGTFERLKLLERVKNEDEFLEILVSIFKRQLFEEKEKEKAKRVLKQILNLEMTNYLNKTNKRSLLEFLIFQI
jgi:DNA polymerase-3 subunit delta'